MIKKTLCDIVAYLSFLNTNGYPIRLSEWDALFAPYAEGEWAPFLHGGEPACDAVFIRHSKKAIVCLHPLVETDEAIVAPLGYMFERLYEQCDEYSGASPIMNACNRALAYIKANYAHDISVKDVAKGPGYSVSYFGYCFKQIRGISVNRYIPEVRLEKAAQLLEHTPLSASAISEKVGFADANYFSAVFKTIYGVPPANIAKQSNCREDLFTAVAFLYLCFLYGFKSKKRGFNFVVMCARYGRLELGDVQQRR